jgi:hypothetical protein
MSSSITGQRAQGIQSRKQAFPNGQALPRSVPITPFSLEQSVSEPPKPMLGRKQPAWGNFYNFGTVPRPLR